MEYDVLIIGAGPAGSITGWNIAREQLSVLMIDKKKEVGVPVQCAEYIPALLSKEITIPGDAIANEIKGSKIYFPDNSSYKFAAPGYILHRAIFDKYLTLNAVKAGACLWLKTKFLGIENGRILLSRNGRLIEVKSKIIVGADGPNSRVGRLINSRYKDYVTAYQQELPLVEKMEFTEVYFDNKFFGGYAWLFPKKYSANVGVGVKTGKKIKVKELFQQFVERLVKEKKIINTPLKTTTGLIPVGGPIDTVRNNILLVGDAAGQTHPITGAGIPQAIICGKFAARSITKALRKKDLIVLNTYEEEWKNLYLEELNRAIKKRDLMENNWNNIRNILKECWVSFPEYYG
ncbi:MAG: NAD(P)/FAD-dependent oxidoreductase [candidate division WOR-3 bacterium]